MKTSRSWTATKQFLIALVLVGVLSPRLLHAQLVGDPFSGYTDSTSYFLDYSSGSFAQGNTSDVQVNVTVNGITNSVDVDTGSRGYFASSDLLGTFSPSEIAAEYPGQVVLTSSNRDLSGNWVPTTASFDVHPVVNGTVSSSVVTVHSSVNVLDVNTLSAGTGPAGSATFGVNSNPTGSHVYNSVNLDQGGTVPIIDGTVTLSGTQSISYSNNPKGLIKSDSNFGIGFAVTGNPAGTGPLGNNQNQIYNPLINIAGMGKGGSLVAGYVVTPDGIQLGLSTPTGSLTAGNALNDKGYAYTNLTPTQFTSNNSQPDWQTPLGHTSIGGTINTINGSGSVVMDTGIGYARITAPELDPTVTGSITAPISVYLLNSGPNSPVGYNIDLTGTSSLNPSYVEPIPQQTGILSQTNPPYGSYFFNTGRDVFEGFNMLYDAQNGYMGVLPTTYGDSLIASGDLFFNPQAGGFPDPIPEPSGRTTALILLGLVVALKYCADKRRMLRP